MSLSDDQVRRLARLARIATRPEETDALAQRLNRVLTLVDELRAVDTSGIEPMSHPLDVQSEQGQRLRPDALAHTDERALYQSVAPSVEDGLYLVPKVIE